MNPRNYGISRTRGFVIKLASRAGMCIRNPWPSFHSAVIRSRYYALLLGFPLFFLSFSLLFAKVYHLIMYHLIMTGETAILRPRVKMRTQGGLLFSGNGVRIFRDAVLSVSNVQEDICTCTEYTLLISSFLFILYYLFYICRLVFHYLPFSNFKMEQLFKY